MTSQASYVAVLNVLEWESGLHPCIHPPSNVRDSELRELTVGVSPSILFILARPPRPLLASQERAHQT